MEKYVVIEIELSDFHSITIGEKHGKIICSFNTMDNNPKLMLELANKICNNLNKQL